MITHACTARGCATAFVVGIALFTCPTASGSGADDARPDTERWLKFMRGHGHDIDRHELHVREDGLVESATRYPRTSSEGWTADEHQRGSYEYIERVIDCETGLYVDIRITLLDKQNEPVATRPISRDDQLENVALRQSDVARHAWPRNSDILFACVAASNPDASDTQVLEIAQTITTTRNEPLFDVAPLKYSPPPDSHSIFAKLREQYDAHRSSFIPEPTAIASHVETMAPVEESERWLELEGVRIDTAATKPLGNGVISIVQDVSDYMGWDDWTSAELPEEYDLQLVVALDCRNGLAVPVERMFFDSEDGHLLQRESTHVTNTLENAPQTIAWTQWLGPRGSLYGQACRNAAQRCGAPTGGSLFEIAPTTLTNLRDADLLAAARDAWLAHRAGFVPACATGASQ